MGFKVMFQPMKTLWNNQIMLITVSIISNNYLSIMLRTFLIHSFIYFEIYNLLLVNIITTHAMHDHNLFFLWNELCVID